MATKNKIFDFINAMTVLKTPVGEIDFTGYSPFIIDKLIGSAEIFIPIVQKVNVRKLSNKQHYQFYKSILPKRRIYSTSIKADADYLKKIKAISKFHECGTRDAEIYLKVLDIESVNNIVRIVEDKL